MHGICNIYSYTMPTRGLSRIQRQLTAYYSPITHINFSSWSWCTVSTVCHYSHCNLTRCCWQWDHCICRYRSRYNSNVLSAVSWDSEIFDRVAIIIVCLHMNKTEQLPCVQVCIKGMSVGMCIIQKYGRLLSYYRHMLLSLSFSILESLQWLALVWDLYCTWCYYSDSTTEYWTSPGESNIIIVADV